MKAGAQITGVVMVPFTGGLSLGISVAGALIGITGVGIATASDKSKNKKHRKEWAERILTDNFFINILDRLFNNHNLF